MTKYRVSGIIFFFSLFVVSITAFSQSPLPKGKWWKHPEVQEKAHLSEEQIEHIEKIYDESMREIIGLEAKLKIAQLDLDNLLDRMDEETINLEALEKQIDALTSIRGELEKKKLMMLARIRNVLPTETVRLLKNLRGRLRKGRMRKRKGIFGSENRKALNQD